MVNTNSKFLLSTLYLGVFLFFFTISMPFADNAVAYIENNFFYDKVTAVIGESTIFVTVANTEDKRIKGLSGKKSIDKNEGMYFIFDYPDKYGIWMKDMNFPIDIIWINSHHEVVYILEKVSPNTYPKVFKPNKDAMYVLELNAGFVETHNIKKGDIFTSI